MRFQSFLLLKVCPPDIHSQADFPILAPYSDDKKNKWKLKVVPKSGWQSIEKNIQKTYSKKLHKSELKVHEHVIKKHKNIQDKANIKDASSWKNRISNENFNPKYSIHKYAVNSPGVSIF